MTKTTSITDKDIFDYVFQRFKLSEEKIRKIENSKRYKDRIEYYRELKKEITENRDPEIG